MNIKCFIGEMLFKLYDRHLEKALSMPFSTEEEKKAYHDYSTYWLGEFKFNIIVDEAEHLAMNGDYTGCMTMEKTARMRHWYKYSYIYKRLLEGKSFNDTIMILFY